MRPRSWSGPDDDPDGQPHAELFERREPRAVEPSTAVVVFAPAE